MGRLIWMCMGCREIRFKRTRIFPSNPLETTPQNVKITTKEVMHNGILRNLGTNLLRTNDFKEDV